MFEIIVGLATIASCFIAYLALRHQRSQPLPQSGNAVPEQSAPSETDSGHPERVIPKGITFGTKALLIPGLQVRLFTHSGWIEDDLLRDKQYCWIERGDVIGRYHMDVPNSDADYLRHLMGTEHMSVDIMSPVSGLVLHRTLTHFVEWPKPGTDESKLPVSGFAVLMPDDEPPPENNDYMFRGAINFIRQHKGPLFRDSRYWTMGPMEEEQFAKLIQLQKEAECIEVNALPRYEDYLNEARTRFPSLRPHLKHLIAEPTTS